MYLIYIIYLILGLKKLDLVHNELTALPKAMGEMRKLECLYVQHNNIGELPEFVGCESIKEIHISNNFITDIPADFCESLPQLKVLDLKDNKIEKLPDEINMLQSLMRLDLSNNSILSIPNNLSTLAHLVSLQLDGNPIRSIRRDIIQSGTARIMKTLRDRAGQISQPQGSQSTIIGDSSTFPDKYKMKKTRSLALGMKALAEVPDSVFEAAKEAEVTVVDLSKNRFTAIPDGLQFLSNDLTELNFSTNLLSNLPVFISQFKRIMYLNLSKNKFTTLPSEIGLLLTLRELNLNNNNLEAIPVCVFDLVHLEILLLADNKITEIDATGEGLGALKRLATLDLSNNNIEVVPPILGNMKQIRALEITGNKFRQPRHQILAKGTESVMAYLRDRIPNNPGTG